MGGRKGSDGNGAACSTGGKDARGDRLVGVRTERLAIVSWKRSRY